MYKTLFVLFILLAIFIVSGSSPAAAAGHLYVSTTGSDNGICSQANPCRTILHALSVAVDNDTINVAGGNYYESVPVSKDVTISGNDPCTPCTVWYAGSSGRVITISSANVTVRNFNIRGGRATYGGGISATIGATVNLQNLFVYENSAERGGAIYNSGNMTLDDVFVNRNTAELEGGGIYNSGTITLENSTVLQNETMDGGGIYNKGSLTINASRIESNEVQGDGAGIYNEGELDVSNSTINNNEAPHGVSGGVYNTGTRAVIVTSEIKANRSRGICKYLPGQDPVCDGDPAGGGVYNAREGSLVLSVVDVLGNRVDADDEREGRGGGVANFGHIIIAFSTIADNKVDTSDYMEPWSDGRSYGGGFYNDGRAEIYNSTFSNNEALDNSFSYSYGGGIYNSTSGEIYMENSTISSNFVEAGGGGGGGGIANLGYLEMSHGTVSHNKANDREEGGPTSGIYNLERGVLVIINSIVAMNPGKNCNNAGDFQTYGQNLDSDESCPDFTIRGEDPLLSPLANNGGPTKTHRPAWQSYAVDKGDPDFCKRNDQRNYPRPYGDSCDLGAVELTEEDRR